MQEFNLTIGGEPRSSAATFDVVNPATAGVYASAPDCSRAQLDEAMEAARCAQPAWAADEAARCEALARCAEILLDAAGTLAPILTGEQGRPLHLSNAEVFGAGMWLQYFADLELEREVVQDDEEAFVEILRRPMGVVAAITPWNFPLMLACWKLGPALRAGNTVVLKPSPFTPLSTLAMGELLSDALPPGVLNVVSGGDDLGGWMTEHPVPRKLSFTGSVATGKRVAAAGAPDLKRVTLELGGNDAAIVLDDASPEAIVEDIFWGAFMNSGQICSAIKRVYVPAGMERELVEALAARADATRVGDGMDPDTELGPISNLPQYERVKALVADAIGGGARAASGGHAMDRPGYFFEPTILTSLDDGVAIVDEEQFGPALPVVPYTSIDDAVRRANASHFGLSGSVWSADPERAAAVASRLECGTAWVNAHLALAPHQPFGGFKWSGIGIENGLPGLHGFTELQVVHTAR